MKYLFAALLLSAQAFACPNLQGTYACPGERGATFIQQSGNIFRIQSAQSTEILIADGKTRAIPKHVNISDGKSVVTCSIDQVFHHQAVNILENGQVAGVSEVATAYALGSSGELKQEIHGYLFLRQRQVPIHETISCPRY